jgi:AAA15 family ATPase/GTPase
MRKTTYKDLEVDISIQSKPLTDEDRKEISAFIAKRKKQLQRQGKLASA